MTGEIAEVGNKLDLSSFETVAVIDDVFDPLDSTRLNKGEIQDFLSALEEDEEAQEQIAGLNISIEFGATDISSDTLQELWKHYPDETKLGNLCKEKLFVHFLQDLHPVNRFCDYLHTDLGLEIITLGVSSDFEELTRKPVKLIFVDYFLGTDIAAPQTENGNEHDRIYSPAQKRSIELIKNIKKQRLNDTKPFVILMSSKDIEPEMIGHFRNETGWLEGMFYFIPKNTFDQKSELSILLGVLAKSLPVGHKIQSFVDGIEISLKKITPEFLKDIRTLSLTDYAYIQKLSLLADGHPLGDYMLWLYGSYLGYLLFENESTVLQQCLELNGLSFKNLPTVQVAPSKHLVKIYKSALFDDHVTEVTDHPLAKSTVTTNEEAGVLHITDHPLFQLGDLFINNTSNCVLMVINPACDLAFSPTEDRKIPSERSIILIHGKLQEIEAPLEEKEIELPRTELFEFNQREYRIVWNVKQVVSHPFNSAAESLRTNGYSRIARLRQPYALEIQNAFASNLTRVGMPVSPPMYQPVDASIFIKGDDGQHKIIGSFSKRYAYIAKVKEREQCILTLEFVMQIMKVATLLTTKLDNDIASLDPNQDGYPKRKERLARRRDEIALSIGNPGDWLQLLTPFELNNGSEKSFPNLQLKVSRGKSTTGVFNHQQQILVTVGAVSVETT